MMLNRKMGTMRRKGKGERGNVKESSFMLNGRLWAAFLRMEKGKTDLPKTRFFRDQGRMTLPLILIAVATNTYSRRD